MLLSKHQRGGFGRPLFLAQRIRELGIRYTPAEALGVTDHAWSIGELLDAALAVAAPDPVESPPRPASAVPRN
jgi:hypothetical protein